MSQTAGGGGNQERVPLAQVFLDDVYLILVLGLGVPFLLYLVWGLMELAQVPLFKP